MVSSYDVIVLNNSQLVVVLIGRLMRGLTSIRSALAPQMQDMRVRKIACEASSSRPVGQTKLSRLILLPYCTAIAGYNTLIIAT